MKKLCYGVLTLLFLLSCEKDTLDELNAKNDHQSHSDVAKNAATGNENLPLILPDGFKWGVQGHPVTSTEYRPPLTPQGLDEYSDLQVDLLNEFQFEHYRIDYAPDATGNIEIWQQPFYERLVSKLHQNNIKILPVLKLSGFEFGESHETLFSKGYNLAQGFLMTHDQNFQVHEDGFKYIEIGNEEEVRCVRKVGKDCVERVIKIGEIGNRDDQYNEPLALQVAAYFAGMIQAIEEFNVSAPNDYKIMINIGDPKHTGFFHILNKGVEIEGELRPINFDVIGVHWYSAKEEEDKIQEDLNLYTGFGKDIWITEVNRRNGSHGSASPDSDPEEDQKSRLLSMINNLSGASQIKAFYIYELFNEPRTRSEEPDEANYGLTKWSSGEHPFLRDQLIYKPVSEMVKFKIEESKHGYEDYVYAIYQKMLERSPEEEGLIFWSDIFENLRNKEDFLGRILPEGSYKLFVQEQYRTLLDKEGDTGGVNYWTARMKNGASREQIIVDFCSGADFWNLSNQNNTDFVIRLYRKLLGKDPDPSDLNHWVNELNSGLPRYTVVVSVIHEDAYLELFVQQQFQKIFDRTGEESGVNFWVNQMKNGLNQNELIVKFLISEEFWNKSIVAGYERRTPFSFLPN